MKSKLWWKEYNPKTFEELILNENIKPALRKALDEVPNLMLTGHYGVGKSAYAGGKREAPQDNWQQSV